ncbi:ABC transporter permease subunit [Allobranchiibius sp. CTAmp26]|uniref:ABC transporter permease subunit n=1 Tax=Allobranchiibius sp. CTAmp26 TaxID=2815214 RepID=UPI001AA12CAF|nr:ABC transporter permease subunit [Allobranchiibius sp. CTAmp26]MBO1755840.1 ABC transporter permease [Allobranchiibius sp. CTAmp26]
MGGAIKAEIRKIFTTRLWWGLLIGDVLLGALISFAWAFQIGTDSAKQSSDPQQHLFATANSASISSVYSAGFVTTIAQLFPLALGVILITSEFRHKTWTSTVLAQPKRWPITVSKIVSIIVVGIVYGVVYDIASVIGGAITLKSFRNSGLLLGNSDVQQTLALMLLIFVVWTLLGFGFGMLIRNQIAAVFIAIGLAFIGNILFNVLFTTLLHWKWAPKYLPGDLTSSILNPNFPGGTDTFSWWAGALVLTAYGLVLAVVGSAINQRKDVL